MSDEIKEEVAEATKTRRCSVIYRYDSPPEVFIKYFLGKDTTEPITYKHLYEVLQKIKDCENTPKVFDGKEEFEDVLCSIELCKLGYVHLSIHFHEDENDGVPTVLFCCPEEYLKNYFNKLRVKYAVYGGLDSGVGFYVSITDSGKEILDKIKNKQAGIPDVSFSSSVFPILKGIPLKAPRGFRNKYIVTETIYSTGDQIDDEKRTHELMEVPAFDENMMQPDLYTQEELCSVSLTGSKHVYWYKEAPVKFLADLFLHGNAIQVNPINIARVIHQINSCPNKNLDFKDGEEELAYSAIIGACQLGYVNLKVVFIDGNAVHRTLIVCKDEKDVSSIIQNEHKIWVWDPWYRNCKAEVQITEEGMKWFVPMWNLNVDQLQFPSSTVYRNQYIIKTPKGYEKHYTREDVYTMGPHTKLGDGKLEIKLTEVDF